MVVRLNEKKLADFVALCAARNDAFGLLKALTVWLRRGKAKRAPQRVQALLSLLEKDPQLRAQTASMFCRWLGSVRLYPLFISVGIFSREGFGRELADRLYERINPSYKDPKDLRDVFAILFSDEHDGRWLTAVPIHLWASLLRLLRAAAGESERETVHRYLRQEGLYAVEMLSIWVAAEELEPDLIRLDTKLLDADSPFVALKREVAHWVEARSSNTPFDDSHLYVMLDQCRRQVEHLRKRGTGAGAGSSLGVAHLLERLEQTLNRMTLLMDVFSPEQIPPRCLLELTGTLANAAAEQHSISWLWKRSVKMLSRSITQNTSDHGEHYITRNKKEFRGLFYSAAGGGVLIALMSLFKIYLGTKIDNHFWRSIAEGLNYGIGFMLIFVLHGTVATKQPAMTASTIAAAVERNDGKRAVNQKLAQLLVDVFRSQGVAVFGNMFVAATLALLITLFYGLYHGTPLLNDAQIRYQLKAIDPAGPTLWYAAIAGVWLFCSGIISGFFDNRCDYLNLRMRLRHHPLLKRLLPQRARNWFADYWHRNYGSLVGNVCFGMLLGITGFFGHATGLPLDIRHVAFSSANVGYTVASGGLGLWVFIRSIVFVLMIGGVNLLVSFSITLWVALRSRETKIDSWWGVFAAFWQIVKERPSVLFWPQPESESPADAKDTKDGKDGGKKPDQAPGAKTDAPPAKPDGKS